MNLHPVARLLHGADFLISAQTVKQCPPDEGLEVAFAGRSNAGKSSAINRLTGQKSLARTSKTPGRTRLINFFQLDVQRRLVDLPGYGYAKVTKAMRLQWQKDLDDYLAERQCLRGVVLLMDIRHPLKEFDQLILEWAAQGGMPLHILLTKSDKLGYGAAKKVLQTVKNSLRDHPGEVSLQLFSATEPRGLEEAWDQLGLWLDYPGPEAASAD